ncbi:MAG: hypothetical protein HY237_07030 [Acidobacteria bacterium]|nr:hypothetical protein [Acidobacteriota bacterium]
MSSRMNPRPLWRCPKCGKYYVTRNMWHACARHTVAEHFARRDPKLKLLFDGLLGLLKRCGPVRIVPGKTGIAFQVRMRFGGVVVRKNCLLAGFILPRRLDHPRIKKLDAYTPRAYGHHVEIRSPDDLDDELAGWLRESYRVGQQLDVLAGRKATPREQGDFAWSEPSFSKSARARIDRLDPPATSRAHAPERQTPLWRCPKCDRTFAIRNQSHICSRYTLREAFRGKSREAVALFRKLAAMARRFGAVKIVPQKTRIALQARKSFLGVRFLRDAIECELALPRRIEHPCFRQILSVSPRNHYHYLRILSAAELDREARAWLREAHRAGQ